MNVLAKQKTILLKKSNKTSLLLFALLLIGINSCTSYTNLYDISRPLTLGLDEADTLSWDYFEGMAQGDKIRVTDKTKNSHDLLFSSVSEGMLYGQAYRNADNLKKVEPYDFSIPIKRISQVKEIGKSPKLKNDEYPEVFHRDFYKLKKGNRVMILKKNTELQYLYFKEFKDGVIYGDSWGSNKKDRNKVPTKAIEIPINEIEEITVKKFNSSRTGLLIIGIGGTFLGLAIYSFIAT